MIAQESQINTCCINPQCIEKNNNVFFHYRNDNYHVKQHNDKVVIIHPMGLKNHFKLGDNSTNFQTKYQSLIVQNIKTITDRMAQKILDFIKDKYFNSIQEKLTTQFKDLQKINQQYLYANLKKGDLELLKHLASFKQMTLEEPFSDFLVNKRLPTISKSIQDKCSQFQNKFLQILDVAIDNIEDLDQIWQEKTLQMNKNFVNKEGKRFRGALKQDKNLVNRDEQSQKQQSNRFNSNSQLRKRKYIKKRHKANNKNQEQSIEVQQQHIIPYENNELQSYYIKKSPKEEIQVQGNKLKVLLCTNPHQTLYYISQNYKDLKEINIFHHNFARQDNLKRLIKLYPNLQKLSLNCYHGFQSQVLQLMSHNQRDNMKFLQLYWNIDEYFLQYHRQSYFADKKQELNRRIKYTNIPIKTLNQFKNNKTVLLHNTQQIQQFQNVKSIKTLHFIPYHQSLPCKFKTLQNKNFTNLLTLNLMSIDFQQISPSDFQSFIKNNLSIRVLILSGLLKVNGRINDFLRSLKLLYNLTHFSYTQLLYPKELIQPDTIFSLVNLQSLFLDGIRFKNQNNKQDSSNLYSLIKLKKLKSLSVYQCKPFFSDIFNHLNPQVYNQMIFLNIARTNIQQNSINYILRMKNLKYLNLDDLNNISSQALANGCQKFNAVNGYKWGLEYLSIKGRANAKNRQLQDFKKMGTYLPIIFTNYDFQQFKKLQTLSITQSLYETIHPLTPNINKHIISN